MQIEGQQVERNQTQQEKAAMGKLERIKLDQGKRADDLQRDAAEAELKVTCHLCNHWRAAPNLSVASGCIACYLQIHEVEVLCLPGLCQTFCFSFVFFFCFSPLLILLLRCVFVVLSAVPCLCL